jgi:hypothetical protein
MFVRFVVGADRENAAWLNGVIGEAQRLDAAGELFRHESKQLSETFDWLNENLPCPPFQEKLRSGDWTREAVCWFKPGAGEPLGRIWDIVAVLREHGTPVRMVTARNPGRIVYEDRFQVVAETLAWA